MIMTMTLKPMVNSASYHVQEIFYFYEKKFHILYTFMFLLYRSFIIKKKWLQTIENISGENFLLQYSQNVNMSGKLHCCTGYSSEIIQHEHIALFEAPNIFFFSFAEKVTEIKIQGWH